MHQTGRIYVGVGFALGIALAVEMILMPGGSTHFLLTSRVSHLGFPISLALMASGAVITRLDRAEERRRIGETGGASARRLDA